MVYVFLADGFEEIEALTSVDILRRGGVEVQTVGVTGKTPTGARGVRVTADIEAAQADIDKADMLVLPGGYPGYENLAKSKLVSDAVDSAVRQQKWVAAICGAPTILGQKGVLAGKEATCFPGMEDALTGARLSDKPVCVDGRIITSRSAGTALDFALTLLAVVKGQQAAHKTARDIHYDGGLY